MLQINFELVKLFHEQRNNTQGTLLPFSAVEPKFRTKQLKKDKAFKKGNLRIKGNFTSSKKYLRRKSCLMEECSSSGLQNTQSSKLNDFVMPYQASLAVSK